METLTFQDLPNHLPKEIRERVYQLYLQPPQDQFEISEGNRILDTITELQEKHPELFEEIVYVANRVSAIVQHVVLDSKHEVDNAFAGFPKQLMVPTDWLRVRHVVLRLKYYDVSTRNVFDTTQSVHVKIPVEIATAMKRIITLQNNNPHLGKLTKVRYELEHLEVRDRHEDDKTMPLTKIVKAFPLANTVWAEPVGSIENPRATRIIRAFNLGRRVFLMGHPPKPKFLEMVIGVAEKGALFDPEDFMIADRKRVLFEEAQLFLEHVKHENWEVSNGLSCAIHCTGCEVVFKGDRPVTIFPQEKCLTRRLFKEHCLRSTKNHGAMAPCPFIPRDHLVLE